MDVTALCFRLLTIALFLAVVNDNFGFSLSVVADFPRVSPERQQFFEYETIVVSCEGQRGLTGWRVMKKISGAVQTCATHWEASTGACNIINAIPKVDSGEYWCEIGAQRSSSINITVTSGSLILEGPRLPVMEGDNVTLRCREKKSNSTHAAKFFKDGVLMNSSPTENVNFHSVTRSNEGLYRCSISGAGESAESWLMVHGVIISPESSEEDSSVQISPQILKVCISVFGLLLVSLLLVGFLRCRRRQTVDTACEDGSANVPVETTYADPFINKPMKKRASEQAAVEDPLNTTYALINHPQ